LAVGFTDGSLGTVIGWSWDFDNDGTEDSTEQNPSYTYQTAGDYTVALTVTGPSGPPDTKVVPNYIHVNEAPPVADFAVDPSTPTSGIKPHGVEFIDLSGGVIVSYEWEFGDGETSTEQHPVHVYQSHGEYTVQLTVNGPDYLDTMEKVDLIYVGNKKWWARTYGDNSGIAHDEASSVDNAVDGGYIVAGTSNDDVWVVKLHEDGFVAWEKNYENGGVEQAHAVKNTADRGYVVSAVADSFGAGDQDLWALKLNAQGTIEWQKTYGTVGDDRAHDIQQTTDDGYVLVGGSGDDMLALRLNPDGTISWQRTYDDVATVLDEAYAVQQTTDAGYVVVGMTDLTGTGAADIRVLRLNTDGTVAWQRDYGDAGGTGDDRAYAVAQTVDGGYIVAGYTSSFGAGGSDIWLLKLNPDGTIAWQKAYGGTGDEEARAVRETVDGGYIVVGSTSSFGRGNQDVWMLKLNTDGSVAWETTYGQIDDDKGMDVQLTYDGQYILAGATEFFGDGYTGFADMWVLRLDQTGEIYSCPPIETGANIIVTDTSVSPVGPTVVAQGGSLNPADTAVTPSDTSGIKSFVCTESVNPAADFSADLLAGGNPLTVQFTDQSKGLITDYLWDFGDDTFGSDQNPVHKYVGIGTYTVKLEVTGPTGTVKKKKIDYINVTDGLPIANFSATPTVGTPDFLVQFTDKSSEKWGRINTYKWDFGDGQIAYGDRAFHMYRSEGPFTVSLTATGPGGSDIKTRTNYIHAPGYTPLYPVIESKKPRKPHPGEYITIVGYNFGENIGDSVVHINGRTIDSSTPNRVKSWTDTEIKVRLPASWYDCAWFNGKNYRFRKAWVTVTGNDSNTKKFKLYVDPDCP
jgi:uncharacterized delta-60 repeat protein